MGEKIKKEVLKEVLRMLKILEDEVDRIGNEIKAIWKEIDLIKKKIESKRKKS